MPFLICFLKKILAMLWSWQCKTSKFPIENVKLRVTGKQKAVLYTLPYTACTGNTGKHLYFLLRVPFSTVQLQN